MKKNLAIFFIVLCVLSLSCTMKKPWKGHDIDEAFLRILHQQGHTKAITQRVGKTLWIYLPEKRELLRYAAAEPTDNPPKRQMTVQYVDAKFEGETFFIEYDLVLATKPQKNLGLSSAYSEKFNQEYRDVTTAILQTYLDSEDPPVFIALVFADIKTGIEMISIFNAQDFLHYQTSGVPQEEFNLRIISETKGDKKIIDDWAGRHLQGYDIPWPDFLSRQIVNRINFKYQRSDFPPGVETEKEILSLVAATVKAYDFKNFQAVKLLDLRSGVSNTFGKEYLVENWRNIK